MSSLSDLLHILVPRRRKYIPNPSETLLCWAFGHTPNCFDCRRRRGDWETTTPISWDPDEHTYTVEYAQASTSEKGGKKCWLGVPPPPHSCPSHRQDWFAWVMTHSRDMLTLWALVAMLFSVAYSHPHDNVFWKYANWTVRSYTNSSCYLCHRFLTSVGFVA